MSYILTTYIPLLPNTVYIKCVCGSESKSGVRAQGVYQ